MLTLKVGKERAAQEKGGTDRAVSPFLFARWRSKFPKLKHLRDGLIMGKPLLSP